MTRGEAFARFCSTCLVHSADEFAGRKFELEPWQGSMMGEALALDAQRRPRWQSVVIVLSRKNGKTTLLAGYALFRLLFDHDLPEILLAAASDRQAGRLFNAAGLFVARSPWLSEQLVVKDYAAEITRRDRAGSILRMSADPRTLHGYNPSLVVCDELAQWTTPSLRRAWAALTTGGGARHRAQTFSISVAGEASSRSTGILGRLLDSNERDGEVERPHEGLTISRNGDARTLIYNYAAPTTNPRETAKIKLANPASWIDEAYLARQAVNPELTTAEFLQLHAGVWAEAETRFVQAVDWHACRVDDAIVPGDEITLGFDGGRTDDSTVLVGCRLDDGLLQPLGAWERPPGAERWQVPLREVDAAVADAHERYVVRRGYYDPPLWQSEIDGWAYEFGETVVVRFDTRSGKMPAAVERFETDVAARLVLQGGQRLLTAHVLNAHRHAARQGYVLAKSSPWSQDKIDGAVAAVLAYQARADELASPRRRRGASRVPMSF